jgi:FMN-dependent NADH-azoreductase
MSKLLYITANPKGIEKSEGLQLGKTFLESFLSRNPDFEVETIDLYTADVPLLDHDVLNGWEQLNNGVEYQSLLPDSQRKIGLINANLAKFMEADYYVFVSPLWNFSIPPVLKAYIDNILVAGKTFAYTEAGPEGLMKGKKAVHIQTSGSAYFNSPIEHLDNGTSYMKQVMGFIGIDDFQTIRLEGVNMPEEKRGIFQEQAKNMLESVVSR